MPSERRDDDRLTSGLAITGAALALIVVLPTLVFLFVYVRFGLTLPPLNLDLLLVYGSAIFVSRHWSRNAGAALAVFGMATALAIQIFFGLGFIYIDNPALIWEYLGFVAVWPWRLIAFWLAVAGAVLLALYWLARRIPLERARVAPALVLLLLVLAVDTAGRLPALHRFVGANVATSSVYRAGKLVHDIATKPRFTAVPIAGRTMRHDAAAVAASGASILSISVEAYGQAHDARYNGYILHDFISRMAPHYRIEMGAHPAKGGTLTGEMRELCQLKTSGTPTRVEAQKIAPRCLPVLLKQAGYRSLAIHGNSGMFYNRDALYPTLGFDGTRFLKDFRGAGVLCRRIAFEGVCDRAALQAATDFLSQGPRRFVHLMTLDTHFPLGPRMAGDDRCDGVPGTDDPALCLYARQFADTFGGIAKALTTARRRPDRVYIFGDHPPPYAVAHERNFFDREHVPYITLVRK